MRAEIAQAKKESTFFPSSSTSDGTSDALAELDEAISLNPLDAMAWFSRGELHRLAQRGGQIRERRRRAGRR